MLQSIQLFIKLKSINHSQTDDLLVSLPTFGSVSSAGSSFPARNGMHLQSIFIFSFAYRYMNRFWKTGKKASPTLLGTKLDSFKSYCLGSVDSGVRVYRKWLECLPSHRATLHTMGAVWKSRSLL